MDKERLAMKAMQDFGNQYVYISHLGEGSYGTVVLCRELSPKDESSASGQRNGQCTTTLVAVKKFKWAHNDELGLGLALREIRLLKSLSHPLIIPLRGAFFSRDCKLYAVFPFIDGGCAQSVLKSRFPRGMPPARLKAFAWQLCLAVRYLHKQKVLHRDIKPANVLLSSDGTIRLCDFGFARRMGDPRAAVAPLQSGIGRDELTPYVQTRPYRAPEVLLGHQYGTAADIWSLGATLAEMATGHVLLPGTSSLDQLWRILGALPGPRPVELQRAVNKLHNLDPAALNHQFPLEMLCPKDLPGPPLVERLSRHGQGNGGGHHGLALAQAHGHGAIGGATPLEPALLDFLMACLQLDPANRPTAEELLQMPYLADAGQLFTGHLVLECLHTALVGEIASAAANASATIPAGVGREEAAAADRSGAAAKVCTAPIPNGSGRLRSCKSGIPSCYQLQKQPINNGFGACVPPQPMVAAVMAAPTLLQNPPYPVAVGGRPNPMSSKVLPPAEDAAPKHRRSLSASSRADALESLRAPRDASGAPRRCPFHLRDLRIAGVWKHLLATSSRSVVMDPVPAHPALGTTRTTDEIPSSPPKKETLQQQQQQQQQAPPLLDSATVEMEMSRTVSMLQYSEPSSEVPQPRGLQKQQQRQQQHIYEKEGGVHMASSWDSTLGPGCWERQLPAATVIRASKQSIDLGPLRRPRFRPGRVKKLPMPIMAPQSPTATGVTAGLGGAPAFGGNMKFSRNISAPDLLQYGQDDSSVAIASAAVMARGCLPPGNVDTGAAQRHAWSQSVCRIDTAAGRLYGDGTQGLRVDRQQQTTQHAAAPANGLDDGARGTATAAARSKTEWPASSSRMAAYKIANAGMYSLLVDAAEPDVDPDDADWDGLSPQCLTVSVGPQPSCLALVPGVRLQDGTQTTTAVAEPQSTTLSRRPTWNAVQAAPEGASIAATGINGGREGVNVVVAPPSPGSSLCGGGGGGGGGGSGHDCCQISGGLDSTLAAFNGWRPTCYGYVDGASTTHMGDIAPPVPKSLLTTMMAATVRGVSATAALPIPEVGANTATAAPTLGRMPFGLGGTAGSSFRQQKILASIRAACAIPTAGAPQVAPRVAATASCSQLATASSMVCIAEDCVFGTWPPRETRVGGTGGDDAQIHGGRSYGTRKSLCDSEDGWLEKVSTWQACDGGKAVAAARGFDTATAGARGARGIQLTSPQLACPFVQEYDGAFRTAADSIPPPRRRQGPRAIATLLGCLGVGRGKRHVGRRCSSSGGSHEE